MSTDQYGAPPRKTWLGVGQNCTSGFSDDPATWSASNQNNLLCKYTPFLGAQGIADGVYRHTANSGPTVVEEIAINGHWKTYDGMHIQAGPFQIVGYTPNHGGFDAWDETWGDYGGKDR